MPGNSLRLVRPARSLVGLGHKCKAGRQNWQEGESQHTEDSTSPAGREILSSEEWGASETFQPLGLGQIGARYGGGICAPQAGSQCGGCGGCPGRPAWPEGVRARTCWLMQALDLSLSCSFPRSPFIICLLLAQGMNKKEAEVRLAFLVLKEFTLLPHEVRRKFILKKVTVANSASCEVKFPHQS